MSAAKLPNVKITLQHSTGAISSYKAGVKPANDTAGGVKEAIVTCFGGTPGDLTTRFELLRADVPGADWTAMERSGAVAELIQRLQRAGLDLSDGHDPHVVVQLGEKGAFGNARFVTDHSQVVLELAADSSKRSLVVPRILPYQLGGDGAGAIAVVYKPVAGGGLRIHSMHPTTGEATLAESNLKASGEPATMCIFVATTVTELVKLVANGKFTKPAEAPALPKAVVANGDADVGAGGRAMSPGLKSPLTMGAPTPFAA